MKAFTSSHSNPLHQLSEGLTAAELLTGAVRGQYLWLHLAEVAAEGLGEGVASQACKDGLAELAERANGMALCLHETLCISLAHDHEGVFLGKDQHPRGRQMSDVDEDSHDG